MIEEVRKMYGRLLKKFHIEKGGPADYTILLLTVMLVLFGIVMVFSSSYYYAMQHPKIDDMYYFVKNQASYALIGMAALTFTACFPYKIYKKFVIFTKVLYNKNSYM